MNLWTHNTNTLHYWVPSHESTYTQTHCIAEYHHFNLCIHKHITLLGAIVSTYIHTTLLDSIASTYIHTNTNTLHYWACLLYTSDAADES